MIRVSLIVAALALAACAPTTTATTEVRPGGVEPVQQTEVAPPTPAEVTTRIRLEQNGQTVNVAVGQRFAVELVGVPTAGYAWSATQTPAFLTASGEATGNTTQAQSQPGFAGGNHWEVFMFTANAAGQGELVLEQRRPWETNQPPAQTFRVTIVAR
ncbi:protease inhibitor I42 family protein [Terricaulis sp.]|uniref:protease inhibitor I42 family protein n=1 Tax=Terricaulis sp. TaxID=2768686 RepID=UPI0037830C7B